jgi:hypothetical protein
MENINVCKRGFNGPIATSDAAVVRFDGGPWDKPIFLRVIGAPYTYM